MRYMKKITALFISFILLITSGYIVTAKEAVFDNIDDYVYLWGKTEVAVNDKITVKVQNDSEVFYLNEFSCEEEGAYFISFPCSLKNAKDYKITLNVRGKYITDTVTNALVVVSDDEVYRLKLSGENENSYLTAGEVITASLEAENVGKDGLYAWVIAEYENGRLTNVKKTEMSLFDGMENFQKESYLTAGDNITQIKAFFIEWNGALTPLTDYAAISLPINVYVKVSGNDETGDGSEDKPFATIKAAKEYVKTIKGSRPINVIIGGGEYQILESIAFDEYDSGTKNAQVTYKAAEGESPVIKSTVELEKDKFENISDSSVKSRMYADAAENVLVYDLKNSGISDDKYSFITAWEENTELLGEYIPTVNFICNGEKQKIARWPNEGYSSIQLASGGSVIGKENSGNAVFYDLSAPTSRWQNAENMYIEGFYTEWHGEWTKATASGFGKIELSGQTRFAIPEKGDRWACVNLLEEIDIPGEYYIDEDEGLLYWYPAESFSEDSKLEFGLSVNLIEIENSEYINFEGLTFEKTSPVAGVHYETELGGNGIVIKDSNNIKVKGCTLKNIGGNGIYLYSAKNITVDQCVIDNIGYSGVLVRRCGTLKKLIRGENVIKNSEISNASLQSRNNAVAGVAVTGWSNYGLEITDNILHDFQNSALKIAGGRVIVKDNEIYNTCIDTSDAGAIYIGRSMVEYGNVYSGNYMHHLGKYGTEVVDGFYLDDSQSGQTLINNIIYPANDSANTVGINVGGGTDNVIIGNIVCGADTGIEVMCRNVDYTATDDVLFTFGFWQVENFQNSSIRNDFEKVYPKMVESFDELNSGIYQPSNIVVGNFLADTVLKTDDTMTEYGFIEKNYIAGSDVFEDAKNGDFRLKEEFRSLYPNIH